MNIDKIKNSLQDLIIRLQDAEKGYKEIVKATSNMPLRNWLNKYADERHQMHRSLEAHVKDLGGDPEVKTSFLGDLHRMFIDLKINNIEDDFDPIVTEIERGATTLIDDYEKVLKEVELPANIITSLTSQKALVEFELENLLKIKEEFQSVEV